MDAVEALDRFSVHSVLVPDDVWRPMRAHIVGLHPAAEEAVQHGLAAARDSPGSSPVGVVVQGQKGSGKTHLLGWVREQVQAQGGYFFLVGLLDASGFWRSVAEAMRDGLTRDDNAQLRRLLVSLADLVHLADSARQVLTGGAAVSRRALDMFVAALRECDRQIGLEAQDTVRALVLLGSGDFGGQDAGQAHLGSVLPDPDEVGRVDEWGLRHQAREPQLVVKDLFRLLALTGPTVLALDQLDILVAQSTRSTAASLEPPEGLKVEQIAGGLTGLRDLAPRTLSIVACLPATWSLIERNAVDTAQDRFEAAPVLHTIRTAALAEAIVQRRLATHYDAVGFTPPYPTWPIQPVAFTSGIGLTPRQLLRRVGDHIRRCARTGVVTELFDLGGAGPATMIEDGRRDGPGRGAVDGLDAIDSRFEVLVRAADGSLALDHLTEDLAVPPLLAAGLSAWIIEQGDAGRPFSIDPPPGSKPGLHARLRRSLDEQSDDEAHWAFRAIGSANAIAVQHRISSATTAAGLVDGVAKRKLFLLRNGDWPSGPRTREMVHDFLASGGLVLPLPAEDLRILAALRHLAAENLPDWTAWLMTRRPTRAVSILRTALAGEGVGDRGSDVTMAVAGAAPLAGLDPTPSGGNGGAGRDRASGPGRHRREVTPVIPVGTPIDGDHPMTLEVEALRRHVAIFAGSGSGKTVLIRRLVEECALCGVSAIVLDPHNDLARLGDPWPEPPDGWSVQDEHRAQGYLADTEVIVWTPRREGGNPLSFQPLPDFGSVRDNVDEFSAAVDAAVAALAPRAKVDGRTHRASVGHAVLTEALRRYAQTGGSDLRAFLDMLADLPNELAGLRKADKIGADLSQALTAATVNDPLFGGGGTPIDPGLLLTPSPHKRARVSVISLVGLPGDEQRQSFVNQLQMALFAWIKTHPAGDRPLGGLFVMDEAQTLAPSGALTACTRSTLALASQARKYGLGLVFATQAPRGLHNQIPGNASTQFFGLLNAPVQIAAAQEMAHAKGGQLPDISRLRSGEFYLAAPGCGFEKVREPMCLTHHPSTPLTVEEVIDRALASRVRVAAVAPR